MLSEALENLKNRIFDVLPHEPRLTPEEIADRIGEGDVEAVKIVLQAMYANGDIEPLYVYQMKDNT